MRKRADFALIFAGGQGSRLSAGGAGTFDKGFLELGGQFFFEIVYGRIYKQAERVAIVAPEVPTWIQDLPDKVRHVQDVFSTGRLRAGPVPALLAGLRAAETINPDSLVLTSPVDSPFVPLDLFQRLNEAIEAQSAPAALVSVSGRLQPVFGLWRASLASTVSQLFEEKGRRALHQIASEIGAFEVSSWDNERMPPPFFNVNTPEDLEVARNLAKQYP